jgi:hypothetical protein
MSLILIRGRVGGVALEGGTDEAAARIVLPAVPSGVFVPRVLATLGT